MIKNREKKDTDRLMGEMIFWSDLSLSITKTNPFFQPMCDSIIVVGPGYKAPAYEELRGPIFQEENNGINVRLEERNKSWESTRCIVMFNSWTDTKGRTLKNFLVHCPRGIMFSKSVNASAHVKDVTLL